MIFFFYFQFNFFFSHCFIALNIADTEVLSQRQTVSKMNKENTT